MKEKKGRRRGVRIKLSEIRVFEEPGSGSTKH